jgi:hypothetical protein
MPGGLRQNTDDYRWVYARFMDPNDDAYDVESYNFDDIWKDPERDLYKKGYDNRQFKYSINRLVKKIRHELESKSLHLVAIMYGRDSNVLSFFACFAC